MASILQKSKITTQSAFKNPVLRKLSGRGYDYKDSVLTNSEAIGSIENEIGWKPQKSVETIFKDIYFWIQKNEKQLESILK